MDIIDFVLDAVTISCIAGIYFAAIGIPKSRIWKRRVKAMLGPAFSLIISGIMSHYTVLLTR